MNIKERLYKIRKEYALESGIEDLFTIREFANIWYDSTRGFDDHSVVIYGAGGNTAILLRLLISWGEINKVCYVYDLNPKVNIINGISVKNNLEFTGNSIRLIWISSFLYRTDMKNELRKRGCRIKYIDPYDALDERITGSGENDIFFRSGSMRSLWFTDRLKKRDLAETYEEKQKLSQELIAGFFCVYDWVSFFEEIGDYLDNNYDDCEFYNELQIEVRNVLSELKTQIKKKRESILIFVIDGLSQNVADSMPNLKKWSELAITFPGYRCEYPGTREAFASFFTGWRPFEDSTYGGKTIHHTDSKLLEQIKMDGIKIKYIGDDHVEMTDYKEINDYQTKWEENALVSEALFNGICELALFEEKQIVIVHTDTTIHYPHISPVIGYTDYNDAADPRRAYKTNFDLAVKYTDDLIGFYTEFLKECDGFTQIVMGDHGVDPDMEFDCLISPRPTSNMGKRWSGKLFNTELSIKLPHCPGRSIDRLISSNQFWIILLNIIRRRDILDGIPIRKSISFEWVPGWDSGYIQKGFEGNNYYYGIGGAGCINEEYLYIQTEDTEEFFYRIVDQEIIEIDNDSEIKNARSSLGEEEIKNSGFSNSILSREFFSVHNQLYNVFRQKKEV